jgi:glutamate-1-semialdehyde aminotransferase/spore coat polysaccharide biosynthesis protein SpsF (cytidylyltransferase family)
MNVLLITQARIGSTRLPGKVLKTIGNKSLLEIHLQRLSKSSKADEILVATTDQAQDEVIVAAVEKLGFLCVRGSENDVLDRFYKAALPFSPKWVVRVTSDCPLIDSEIVDAVIEKAQAGGLDYCSNVFVERFPDGQDVEVFRFESLVAAWNNARLPSEREHVTPYIRTHSTFLGGKLFKSDNVYCDQDFSGIRMTVDEPADFLLMEKLITALGTDKPWLEYVNYIADHKLNQLNSGIVRNEGYAMSLKKDTMKNFAKSEANLERALKTVPLGSQTFSKSKTQLPYGISPYFASGGKGALLYDVDGNEYIDFVNSLASITLGYNDPDVTQAVRDQLENGTIFSLAHELEFIVAEKIVDMVPCAEMVRFGKNGSDATSGAIRLARAYNKKDHVLVCGYHGWQDWYIGSTARNLGVPEATRQLTHTFQYNDIDSLKKLFATYKDQVAAVILEPVNVYPPKDDFLQKVKSVTHENNAVLIFDETITGFRYANGGAQEFFNVIPDLACFGKGLANGYPVSALAGKAEIMRLMEEIFFSFTFGGELLSLAAASATLDKLKNEPVVAHLNKIGESIITQLTNLISEHKLQAVFDVAGYPVWSFFTIKDTDKFTQWEIKTLFLQEMFKRGIFIIGTHNISYSHTPAHVAKLMAAYSEFFKLMQKCTEEGNIKKYIEGKVLEPLFKVR